MKLYCIFTVDTNENGETLIKFFKDLHFFKEAAFEKANKIGESACVVELTETSSWNHDQRMAEEI